MSPGIKPVFTSWLKCQGIQRLKAPVDAFHIVFNHIPIVRRELFLFVNLIDHPDITQKRCLFFHFPQPVLIICFQILPEETIEKL